MGSPYILTLGGGDDDDDSDTVVWVWVAKGLSCLHTYISVNMSCVAACHLTASFIWLSQERELGICSVDATHRFRNPLMIAADEVFFYYNTTLDSSSRREYRGLLIQYLLDT